MIKKILISILIIVITVLNLFLFKRYYEKKLQNIKLNDTLVIENQVN